MDERTRREILALIGTPAIAFAASTKSVVSSARAMEKKLSVSLKRPGRVLNLAARDPITGDTNIYGGIAVSPDGRYLAWGRSIFQHEWQHPEIPFLTIE